MWQKSQTLIVTTPKTKKITKVENSYYDKTQKLWWWQHSKSQIVTKIKDSNCDKTQIVIKLKSNCDKTKKKTQIGTKLNNSKCDKTQNSNSDKKSISDKNYFGKNNRWAVLGAAFCNLALFFLQYYCSTVLCLFSIYLEFVLQYYSSPGL